MERKYDRLLDGEDIMLEGGEMFETDAGDIATVTSVAAARQSVIRELPASPGSSPRRPAWGAGLSSSVNRSVTSSELARLSSRCRARLLVNPRVRRVNGCSATLGEYGAVVEIRVDSLEGSIEERVVINGGG